MQACIVQLNSVITQPNLKLNLASNSRIFQHRDTQETLAVLDRLDLDTDKPSEEDLAKKFGYEDDYYSGIVGTGVLLVCSYLPRNC